MLAGDRTLDAGFPEHVCLPRGIPRKDVTRQIQVSKRLKIIWSHDMNDNK
jgi:hypothetical protein